MRSLFFTKHYRIRARALACDCFNQCSGDATKAYAMAVSRKDEVGSVIVMITISALVLQAIYYALKIWAEMNESKAPILPVPGEGFGLGINERYALTRAERKCILEGGCGGRS